MAAASNDAFSSACLWACVHTQCLQPGARTHSFRRAIRVTSLWATCRSWLLGEKKSQKICNNIGNWVGGRGGDLLLAVDVLRVTLPAVTCGMRSAWRGVAELAALQQFQDVLAWNCSPLASQGEFPPGPSVKRASLQHSATAPPVIHAALGKPWCLCASTAREAENPACCWSSPYQNHLTAGQI